MGDLISGVMNAVSSLLGGTKPSAAAAPAVAPTPVMPTADSAAVEAARRKALLAAQARGGRTSTMLSDSNNQGSDKLGG